MNKFFSRNACMPERSGIVKVVKEKKVAKQECNTWKNSFKNEIEIETFLDKQKLKEFITNRCLVEIAKGNSSSWDERMLVSNTKAYATVKLIGKNKYMTNTEYSSTVMVMCKSLLILV